MDNSPLAYEIKPDIQGYEIEFYKYVADLVGKKKDPMLQNWEDKFFETVIGINRDSPIYKALYLGISILIDDFVENLSRGDISGYLQANHDLAYKISAGDIPKRLLTWGFHLFESSYGLLLKGDGLSLNQQFITLDKLHHLTIGELDQAYSDLQETITFYLTKMAELKDPETNNHLMRTREYAAVISEELGCDSVFVHTLYLAAPLHDIGKVGISDGILFKPSGLSEGEFNHIKEHTDLGEKTLKEIISARNITSGPMIMGAEIAGCHHEKYSGGGYRKLSGEEIPLSARIFTLADIYDALRTERPYKRALSHEETFKIITQGDGRTSPLDFEQKVLEAFKKVEHKFIEISQI